MGPAHEVWTYNADGHVLTETNPDGRTLSHTVDALGRRTLTVDQQAQAGDAATRAFVYDGNDNLTAIHDTLQGGGVRDQTTRYDAFDRPEHQADVTGGVIDWTYDANGNRTRAREDGEDTVWTYDPLNRNTAITVTAQGTTALDYFPSGLLKQVTRPDGSTTEHGYDAAGRLETLAHAKAGSAIAQLRYRYDLNGNVGLRKTLQPHLRPLHQPRPGRRQRSEPDQSEWVFGVQWGADVVHRSQRALCKCAVCVGNGIRVLEDR